MLENRPVFQPWDATIRGHIFGLFLALVRLDELKRRLSRRGWQLEWADIRLDLAALMEIDKRQGEQWYYLRNARQGGPERHSKPHAVAIPPSVQPILENFGAKG